MQYLLIFKNAKYITFLKQHLQNLIFCSWSSHIYVYTSTWTKRKITIIFKKAPNDFRKLVNLCYSKALTYKYKHCTISGTLCNMTYFYFQVQSQLCLPLGITLIIKEGTAKLLSDECLGIELPCLSWDKRESWERAGPHQLPHSTRRNTRSLAPFNEKQMQQRSFSLSRSFMQSMRWTNTHLFLKRRSNKCYGGSWNRVIVCLYSSTHT